MVNWHAMVERVEPRTVFDETEKKLLNWMVFEYDELKTANADRASAEQLGLDIGEVKGKISSLEERFKCDRVRVFSVVTKVAMLSGQLDAGQLAEDLPDLSAAEGAVLTHIYKGNTNKEIMEQRNLSLEYFSAIRNRIYRKFGAKNRYFVIASIALIRQKANAAKNN